MVVWIRWLPAQLPHLGVQRSALYLEKYHSSQQSIHVERHKGSLSRQKEIVVTTQHYVRPSGEKFIASLLLVEIKKSVERLLETSSWALTKTV